MAANSSKTTDTRSLVVFHKCRLTSTWIEGWGCVLTSRDTAAESLLWLHPPAPPGPASVFLLGKSKGEINSIPIKKGKRPLHQTFHISQCIAPQRQTNPMVCKHVWKSDFRTGNYLFLGPCDFRDHGSVDRIAGLTNKNDFFNME